MPVLEDKFLTSINHFTLFLRQKLYINETFTISILNLFWLSRLLTKAK